MTLQIDARIVDQGHQSEGPSCELQGISAVAPVAAIVAVVVVVVCESSPDAAAIRHYRCSI